MNRNVERRFDADLHVVSANAKNANDDLAIDHNVLILLSRQDQHVVYLVLA